MIVYHFFSKGAFSKYSNSADDTLWLQAEGARRMTQVYRPTPTVRGVTHEPALAQATTRVSHGAAYKHGRVFTPGPRPGTHRNAMRFETYKRTPDACPGRVEKTRRKGLPDGSAAFIPMDKSSGLSPRYGKVGHRVYATIQRA
jgi:hypothetical protein